jgi:multidrug efflux pump subunit AcrA (membrane-fusion protein)
MRDVFPAQNVDRSKFHDCVQAQSINQHGLCGISQDVIGRLPDSQKWISRQNCCFRKSSPSRNPSDESVDGNSNTLLPDFCFHRGVGLDLERYRNRPQTAIGNAFRTENIRFQRPIPVWRFFGSRYTRGNLRKSGRILKNSRLLSSFRPIREWNRMSPSPAPSMTPTPAGDALRLQMERSIDELAELARSEIEPGRFFAEVLRRALQPGGASHVVLWRMSLDGLWEPAGEMPPGNGPVDIPTTDRQELLNEIARQSQPWIHSRSENIPGLSAGGSQVFSPLRHAGVTVGILEAVHALPVGGNLAPATYQFFAALSEITADFLSQQELLQLRRAKANWAQWDQYQSRLNQSLDLASACAVIANDGRVVVSCDRITVLVRRGRRYQVHAISGVERADSRAGSVQSLELLVRLTVAHGTTIWSTLPTELAETDLNPIVARHHRESGTKCLGLIPIVARGSGESTLDDEPIAVIIFENFDTEGDWTEMQSRAEALVQRSSFALEAAIERRELPGLQAWQRLRRGWKVLRRPRTTVAAFVLAAVIAALIIIPAEFTITGHGELWPDVRRDVFATTSSIVDQVLVKHGDVVRPNQPLIVLRDPELDQDIPKISGEIATTAERLRGVQIARLTGATAQDAASRLRNLTADEEELKERLKSLERQRLLVEERRQRLTLRSPIAGNVLTWDLAQHLSARPVERGQSLLTVGETTGSWVMEIQVADKDAGHMLRAQKSLGTGLNVDFQLPAEPGRIHHGTIREVSLASESNDRSSGHVRVVVAFERDQVEQLRPGATAIPRIRCGRRSLGYVWLHDLIDAIQIRLLF